MSSPSQIMGAYCERKGLNREATRFHFDGKALNPEMTVGQLEMEDGDVVDVSQTMARRAPPARAPAPRPRQLWWLLHAASTRRSDAAAWRAIIATLCRSGEAPDLLERNGRLRPLAAKHHAAQPRRGRGGRRAPRARALAHACAAAGARPAKGGPSFLFGLLLDLMLSTIAQTNGGRQLRARGEGTWSSAAGISPCPCPCPCPLCASLLSVLRFFHCFSCWCCPSLPSGRTVVAQAEGNSASSMRR